MLLTATAVAAVASGAGRFAAAAVDLSQSEVENLGVSAFGDENVRGLDVAVNDAAGVGRVESVGDLDAEPSRIVRVPSGGPRSGA